MAERETLASRLGFILLSAGCAIGLGNVWRFPYITGQYGGAVFVLIYLVFLIIIGLPVMVMEFSIGRASGKNIAGALKKLEPAGTKWHWYGPVAIAGNYLLMMFYTTITGWLLYYFIKTAAGSVSSLDSTSSEIFFSSLQASPLTQIIFMAASVTIGFIICLGGLQKGVEKASKIMMILLLAIMLVLVVNSLLIPGGGEGLRFYLVPDIERLKAAGVWEAIFAAMSQAFFTLSLGIGAMAIFGSYFDNERTLGGESVRIICLDTTIALLSGFIIFPACSAFGVEPGSGPSLLFLSLPTVFTQMAGGRLWGAVFFLAMIFAALSTLIAVFENICSYWMDSRGWTRRNAVILNFILLFFLSIPCVLGFNVLSGFQPFGEGTGVLDAEDFLVSNLILPLGSLVFVLFCTHRSGWGWKNFLKEANQGKGLKVPAGLRFYCAWILPIIILLVTVNGIYGVLA